MRSILAKSKVEGKRTKTYNNNGKTKIQRYCQCDLQVLLILGNLFDNTKIRKKFK